MTAVLPIPARLRITSPPLKATRQRIRNKNSGFVHPTMQLYEIHLAQSVRRSSSPHGQRRHRIGYGRMQPKSEVESIMPVVMRRLQRVGQDLGPVRMPVLVLVLLSGQERLGQDTARLLGELGHQIRFWEREKQRYVNLISTTSLPYDLQYQNSSANSILYRKATIVRGLMLESKQNLYHDIVSLSLLT